MASVINDKCNNCAACAPVCPTGSVITGSHHYVIDSDTCEDCHICIAVCPVAAIIGKKKAPPPEEGDDKEKKKPRRPDPGIKGT